MSAKLTFGQINNVDFELWDTVYTNDASDVLANSFGVPNPLGGNVNNWTAEWNGLGVSRTTDSYSGNYSLIVHNWYNYLQGGISYHNAISYTPQYLQGYYKYNTSGSGSNGLSQGKATVTLTRFNGTSNDTISTGSYLFDSTNVFIPFQLNTGLTSLIADSVSIYIVNAGIGNSCRGFNNYCNLLYLDNLTLSTIPLGIENLISNENVVSVFPNPFSTETTFKTDEALKDATLEVYNSLGQTVKQIKNISGKTVTLFRDNLPSGLYYIRMRQESKVIATEKLIITD
jgi:hypothetical protein